MGDRPKPSSMRGSSQHLAVLDEVQDFLGSNRSFEAHITVPKGYAQQATNAALGQGWSLSAINGDPVLGAKPHFYLTKHSSSYDALKGYLDQQVSRLRTFGVPVLREKIEEILYDVRHPAP